MKTPFKSVLATFVALSLSIFLSGCFEEDGAKTASQDSGVDHSVFQSQNEGVLGSDGVRRFYLPVGTSALKIKFNTASDRDSNKAFVEKLLKESGIEIDERRSWNARSGRMVEIKPLERKIFVSLPGEVRSVEPFGPGGKKFFEWNSAEGFVIDYRA